VDYNAITPQRLAQFGLNLNDPADQLILRSTISTAAAGRFQGRVPYSGFPTSATVAQSLRPFPQFSGLGSGLGAVLAPLWAPLGQTWYDSLQVKVTKRLSQGLDFTYAFTFAKELQNGTGGNINDVFNRNVNKSLSTLSRPFVHVLAVNYRTPKLGINKYASLVARDWMLGAVLQYSSGTPIAAPTSNNALANYLFRGTYYNRVAGQGLYLKDLNCHCIDPRKDLVLNPAAWAEAPVGQFGQTALYFNDYRTQRRPSESMSLARIFQIRERMSFSIRAEFSNIFNRTQMVDPAATNPTAQATVDNAGNRTGGFGFINPSTVAAQPRTGTLVGRFTF
jgi:hypothetical protein